MEDDIQNYLPTVMFRRTPAVYNDKVELTQHFFSQLLFWETSCL